MTRDPWVIAGLVLIVFMLVFVFPAQIRMAIDAGKHVDAERPFRAHGVIP